MWHIPPTDIRRIVDNLHDEEAEHDHHEDQERHRKYYQTESQEREKERFMFVLEHFPPYKNIKYFLKIDLNLDEWDWTLDAASLVI